MKEIVNWIIHLQTVSEANSSEHWTIKKKRHDIQKQSIWYHFLKHKPKINLPCHIKLIRLGRRKLDSDNLPTSMKWIRDAIADSLIPGLQPGRADDDSRLSWEYDQESSKENGVCVIIFERENSR